MSELSLRIPDAVIEAAAHAVAERAVALLVADLSQTSPWMTTEEAAEYLRIPLGTFQERAARGEFDAIGHREGRRVYYHRADLDEHRCRVRARNGALSYRTPAALAGHHG